jgi:hypothetical protein
MISLYISYKQKKKMKIFKRTSGIPEEMWGNLYSEPKQWTSDGALTRSLKTKKIRTQFLFVNCWDQCKVSLRLEKQVKHPQSKNSKSDLCHFS